MSSDDQAIQAHFKREIGAAFSFVSDPKSELIRLFGVKTPLISFAKRTTFVVASDRRIVHVDRGRDAADPDAALAACSL